MKKNYFITKKATTYWKKVIKSDRLTITRDGDKIYILTGYNAFVLPAVQEIYADLVQPATMQAMPADGEYQAWSFGTYNTNPADSMKILVRDMIKAAEGHKARATQFIYTLKGCDARIFIAEDEKSKNLSAVNEDFVKMIDYAQAESVEQINSVSPLVLKSGNFEAILLPIRAEGLQDKLKELL